MNKLNITVAIPAYNEEANIANLVDQIVSQVGNKFVIDNIFIYSDGSSDNTSKIIKDKFFGNKVIKLMNGRKRLGKIRRLNQIYKQNKSEMLLVLDADIVLKDKFSIQNISKFALKNEDVDVVAIHQIPVRPNTFIGRCIYSGYEFWDIARLSVKDQNHIQNLYGAATLYRKRFSDKFYYPDDITDDRGYLYIQATINGKFKYYSGTCIYYLPVSTIHDFWKLSDRSFNKNENLLSKHFGDQVYELYHIPLRYKIKGILVAFAHHPIYTIFGIMLNILVRTIHISDKLYDNNMWEISTSTKKKIKIYE